MSMRKMRSKGVMIVVLLLMVSLISSACNGSQQETSAQNDSTGNSFNERKLKIAHVRPEGTSTDNDIKAFTNYITENTDNKIKFEIYPNSQLGDYPLVQERIGIGDIEMQLAPAAPNINPAIVLPSAPYLASTWDEAREVFKRDGLLYTEISKMFEEENIKLIAGYPKYFGSIITTKEPDDPGNPNVSKGLKIRVPGIKSFELTAEALGYMATPVAFSEAFTAIQTGIVDGAIGSGAEGYYNSFRDVTEYYLPVNSQFEIWWIQMNKDIWDNLTDDEKAAIEEAARKFEKNRWEVAPNEEKEYEKMLEESGATIISFVDEDYKAMANKIRKEVWPEIKDEYGAELFDRITQ